MTDGWRNRYMAPVYALMISFVIVLLAGLWSGAETPPAKIRFTVNGEKTWPPELRPDFTVEIFGSEYRQVKVDEHGEAPLPASDKPLMICAQLPAGWSAVDVTRLKNANLTCWRSSGGKQDVVLTLARTGR